MAYIKVDSSRLERTAKVIDTYIGKHKLNMKNATGELDTLSGSWQGADFDQFKSEWYKSTEKGSISQSMIEAMESYADFLRYAANEYKNAQANAVNKANAIPNRSWD
ncbi:MAG: hypothetical protein GX992_04450 [Clostridium sp.]|nr:hypothetical protein [Clostridium sp.]